MNLQTTPISPTPRILVADDSLSTQRLIATFLSRAQCDLEFASDGAAAVDAVQRGSYDLILMDISMPKMDGLEATRRIRAMDGGAGVPILALTGDDDLAHRRICLEADMDDILVKPVRREKLLQALSGWTGMAAKSKTGSGDNALLDESTLTRLEEDTSPALAPELVAILFREALGYERDIGRAVGQRDWCECGRLAHALKSNAGTIGAGRLREQALRLEAAVATGDEADIRRCAELLAQVSLATHGAYEQRFHWAKDQVG